MIYPSIITSVKVNSNDTKSIKYSLISGNDTYFSIDSMTGDLILSRPLDYEDIKQFKLTVKAVNVHYHDIFAITNVIVNVIDVNDNYPIFKYPSYSIKIKENTVYNNSLLKIEAMDADTNENGEIRYSISNTDNVPFVINFITGELRLIEMVDYETRSGYTIYVKATDGGRYDQKSATIKVHVHVINENDNYPVLKSMNQDILIRSDMKNGDTVYVIDVYDEDIDDDLKLSIAGQDYEYFTIDKRGVIRANNRLNKQSEYSIMVVAVDEAKHNSTLQINFIVSDTDNFPAFKQLPETRFKLYENITNYEVIKVEATTSKLPNCVRYKIANGNSRNNFKLDSFSGVLMVNHLDYEMTKEHHIYIAGIDCLTSSYVSFQLIIVTVKNINDNPPVFENLFYELSLKENDDPPSEAILHLVARDADMNNKIQYSIIDGNVNNAFEIDTNTGKLYQLLQLDREEYDFYNLTIEAKDDGSPSLSSTCTVYVSYCI